MITTKTYKNDLLNYPDLIEFMYETITYNMSIVMGENFTSDETGKAMWYENNILGTAKRDNWKTVIAFDDKTPCAYFQYGKYADNEVLWGEMEIEKLHQGDGRTFFSLINHFLNDNDFIDCEYIRGYINKKNLKSQAVFTSIGLKKVEETARGAKYIGSRYDIENWMKKKNLKLFPFCEDN